MKIINKIFAIFAITVLLVSFLSCSPRYGIANSGGEPIYFTKPVYRDSSINANYIGGKFCHTIDSAYSNKNETNYFGEIYFYRSHTTQYYNFSYGLFSYAGSYKVNKIEKYRGNKSYYGGGFSGEFNINIPLKVVDLRLFGIRGTILYEDGDFSNYRKKASDEKLIDNQNISNYLYNLSVSNECEFKLQKSSFGLYNSMGLTKNFHDKSGFLTITSSIHYTIRKYTAYFQYTECVWGIGDIYSLGLDYKIK